jgi:hypothetical protein
MIAGEAENYIISHIRWEDFDEPFLDAIIKQAEELIQKIYDEFPIPQEYKKQL